MTDVIQAELLRSQLKSEHKTNHVLHVLLSIITSGVWLVVYGCVVVRNWRLRSEVDERFNEAGIQILKK